MYLPDGSGLSRHGVPLECKSRSPSTYQPMLKVTVHCLPFRPYPRSESAYRTVSPSVIPTRTSRMAYRGFDADSQDYQPSQTRPFGESLAGAYAAEYEREHQKSEDSDDARSERNQSAVAKRRIAR